MKSGYARVNDDGNGAKMRYNSRTNRPRIVTHPAHEKLPYGSLFHHAVISNEKASCRRADARGRFHNGLDAENRYFIGRMPCSVVQGTVNSYKDSTQFGK